MSQPKDTPDPLLNLLTPWKVTHTMVNYEGMTMIGDAQDGYFPIARVICGSDKERELRAAIIAIAPDMFAFAKKVEALLRMGWTANELTELEEEARALIAKATNNAAGL